MKRKRFTEEQIISILREREAGMAVADLSLDKQMLEDVIKQSKKLVTPAAKRRAAGRLLKTYRVSQRRVARYRSRHDRTSAGRWTSCRINSPTAGDYAFSTWSMTTPDSASVRPWTLRSRVSVWHATWMNSVSDNRCPRLWSASTDRN